MKYVSPAGHKKVARALKPIYTAAAESEALTALQSRNGLVAAQGKIAHADHPRYGLLR